MPIKTNALKIMSKPNFCTSPRANRLSVIKTLAILMSIAILSGCSTPQVTTSETAQAPRIGTDNRDIDRLLLEAARTTPPKSTELSLLAARRAIEQDNAELATRILDNLESPYVTANTTREFSFLRAEIALADKDSKLAIRLLDDPRLQQLQLNSDTQVIAGDLRARAYEMGRSYLASARERIYINRLLSSDQREKNHEKIFSTLLMLPEETLRTQAEKSITSEIRGWLSLAAMTRRYQYDPLRQLNALKDWRRAWPNHPASIIVPNSLQMLSRIVDEQPESVALVLPLRGELSSIGKAIRDGFIAAHYQLTPDAKLRIYDSTQGEILEIIARAEREGAELIIGPLDRQKVTELAGQTLPMPIIALNRTEHGEINPNLYQFGLAPEDESIQVAEQIIREGRFNGLVIAPESDWGDRNFAAFSEKFTAGGGIIIDSARFQEQRDYSDMVKNVLNIDSSEKRASDLRRITGERFEFNARRRQDIDFVFLLATPGQARGINPTLAFFYADDIPVYATSHVYVTSGSKIDTLDMNGIRFCDIPWKLSSTDDTQQLISDTWPDAKSPLAPFYALGVDVLRLYPRLQQLKEFPDEKIFGSTGVLTLNKDNVVNRTLMWAQFKNGEVSAIPMIFDTPL